MRSAYNREFGVADRPDRIGPTQVLRMPDFTVNRSRIVGVENRGHFVFTEERPWDRWLSFAELRA
jgi:hypothetical protein